MEYAIASILSLIEIVLIGVYLKKLNIFNEVCLEEGDLSSPTKFSTKTQYLVAMSVIAIVLLGSSLWLVNRVSNIPNLIKLIVLTGILAAAAAVDLKQTIIPNKLIFIGLIVRVIIYVVELLFYNEIFVPQLISDVIGFAIGFGILCIASVVSKGALGFGDVKLFGVIGLMTGAICTYSTLIFGLLLSVIVSVVLMIAKKKSRKDSIPFGPFIFAGYIIAISLTCY